MFDFYTPQYTIAVDTAALPYVYESYVKNAKLVDEFELSGEGEVCYVGVTRTGDEWPCLVVAQRSAPAAFGFHSGVLLVPETQMLFLAAGERLLAYELSGPSRVWVDTADCGFWRWQRHEEIVLMHAEIELAAWSTEGKKLWSVFADPPWSCEVAGKYIKLSDCRGTREFHLRSGAPQPNSA